jgi:glycerophosphoryl diester phosphodiesterase
MQTNAAPVSGASARSSARSAAGSAGRLLRRRILLVLVVSIATQGAYFWGVLPLLLTLFQTVLTAAGIDGLSLSGLPALVRSPLAILVLLLIALLATAFALVEVTVFSVIAHLCLRGETPSAQAIVRGVWRLLRRAASWQIVLVAGYALLVLPLSHLGVGATLTSHISIPKFISGELTTTTAGAWAYALVTVGLLYLALRLAMTAAALAGEEHTVWRAMRRSIVVTRRTQLPIAVVFLVVGAAAAVVYAAAALVGTIPVALAADPEAGAQVGGTMLALLDLVRFLATGAAAAFLAFFFVALYRGPAPVTPAVRPVRDATSRVLATTVLVLFGVLSVPPIAFATLASTETASPLIIAHRGYTAGGVENTIPALRAAAEAGADVVEMDIQETADEGFVVIHDVGLQRLAGDPRSVFELDEAEASGITVRQGEFASRIPTLAEYLRTADELGVQVLVEVKPHGHEAPGFADRVVQAMNDLDPAHHHMIQSLDAGIVDEIIAADPARTVALVTGFQIGDAPRTDADAVAIEDWSYSDEMLVRLHDDDKQLFVWTVDDVSLLTEYLGRGVDGVITDRVREAVTARELDETITNPVSRYLSAASRTIRPW